MEIREKKLIELFSNYSISTLDSISFVLAKGKSKNKDIMEALADAYSCKSSLAISATTEEAVAKIFTLDEVKKDLVTMPDYAADLINKEVRKAYYKIGDELKKSTNEEQKERLSGIFDKISDFLNEYKEAVRKKEEIEEEIRSQYLLRAHSTWIDDNYSDEELKTFFNKFGVNEIGKIYTSFICAMDFFSHRFFNIYNKTQFEMTENNNETYIRPETEEEKHNYTCIVKKLDMLTDKELELLKIGSVDSLNFCLAKSRKDSDYNIPVNGLTYLAVSVVDEEKNRKRIERLFRKFDRYDQMILRIMFGYATKYRLNREKEKIDYLINNPYSKNLVQSKSLSSLTNKELDYLLKIADNALTVLSMKFGSEKSAEKTAIYYFRERLIEEIGLRAASKGKYNNLNNKKKTKKRKRK